MRHTIQGLLHQRVLLDTDPLGFVLAVNHLNELHPDAILDELYIVVQILIGKVDLIPVQIRLEFRQDVIRDLEVCRDRLMASQVILAEIEEGVSLIECFLGWTQFRIGDSSIRTDSSAPIDLAASVSESHVRMRRGAILEAVVIVVQGNIGVFTLDQAAAGRVVAGGGKRQSSPLAQGIHSLDQAFPEARLAHHQSAIVILQSACDDFSGAGGQAINKDDDRILVPAFAMVRVVAFLRGISPVVVDNQLVLLEEMIGDLNGFL